MAIKAKLTVTSGEASKGEIALKLPTIIGRSRDAQIKVVHSLVSRKHCEIFEADGQLKVRDLKSLNGTEVGGEKISEAVLHPGEELTVGPLTFRVDFEPSDGPEPAPPPAPTSTSSADSTEFEISPVETEVTRDEDSIELMLKEDPVSASEDFAETVRQPEKAELEEAEADEISNLEDVEFLLRDSAELPALEMEVPAIAEESDESVAEEIAELDEVEVIDEIEELEEIEEIEEAPVEEALVEEVRQEPPKPAVAPPKPAAAKPAVAPPAAESPAVAPQKSAPAPKPSQSPGGISIDTGSIAPPVDADDDLEEFFRNME